MRALAIAAAIIASGLRAAAAEPEAERLYKEGQAAYDAERYDDALAAWTQSYELSHLPGLVFNIAQAHRLRGDCAKAVEAYKKFVALDPKSNERPTAEGFIKDLSPCPADKPAPPAPPKSPPATPPAAPKPPTTKLVDVDTGHGKRIAGLAVVGGGLAIAGTGLYFGSRASALGDEVRKACATGCAYPSIRDKDEEGRRDETIQWILYGAGAAAIVSGGVLYMLGSRSASSVAVAPHGDGAVVTFSGAW